MVTLFTTCFLLLTPMGDESASQAQASLALSKAKTVKECGKCRTDLDTCRAEALKTGKPLVILVNMDCHTNALHVPDAIFVKVSSYKADNITPDKSRMILIQKAADGKSLEIQKTVEPMGKDELKKELFQTFPQLKTKLSWV